MHQFQSFVLVYNAFNLKYLSLIYKIQPLYFNKVLCFLLTITNSMLWLVAIQSSHPEQIVTKLTWNFDKVTLNFRY